MALVIAGKYEVLSQVGMGGMGVVYKVRHRTLETILALKVLPAELAEDADLVRRFHQEARVMAQLRHPHIVQVLDVDRDEDLHFFVMEYVDGTSLSQYLRQQGSLPLPEVLTISRQVAQALEYVHTHQPPIIHRDIKPANILLEVRSRRVVVTDFGIAKVLGAGERTRTGLVMGTLRYCAPEQILRDKELDGRADIYSLGLMMYEMLAGRPFFTETDEQALLARVLHGPGENVPAFAGPVPHDFAALVTRAIAREQERRYRQVAELRQGIEACLASHSDTALTVLLGETFSNDEEKPQQKQKATTFPREKRPWWSWRPPLRPMMGITLSLTLVTILSLTYLLVPSRMPWEYDRAFKSLRTGQTDVALSAFQQLVTDPDNSLGLGYDGLAAIYFEQGLLTEAKEAMQQKSLAANPANVMALLTRGDLFFAMGEKEKAIHDYQQAAEAQTPWEWQKALAYNALGVSYFLESKQAEAKSCFNTAILSDKGSFTAYSNLGYLFWQEGNLQEAQRAFEKALTLQRDDELSKTLLAMITTQKSEDLTTGAGEKVLLVPFLPGGGNLRRLGEGEALVWQLARQLPPSMQHEIAGQDALRRGQRGGLIPDPATLITLAREKGAAYII